MEPAHDNRENRNINHAANLPLDTPEMKSITLYFINRPVNQSHNKRYIYR